MAGFGQNKSDKAPHSSTINLHGNS